MAANALTVELRDQAGKGVARKLRAVGRIPGVCYGKNEKAVPISLDAHALKRLLDRSEAGMNTIIDLSGGGDLAGKQVLVRELQRDVAAQTTERFGIGVGNSVENGLRVGPREWPLAGFLASAGTSTILCMDIAKM